MAIVRWEPLRELGSLQTEVNRLFNTMLDAPAAERRWAPAMDVLERDDAYLVRADLPGVHEEDVSIEVEDGILKVTGERKSETDFEGSTGHRIERVHGRFMRSLTLPRGVDPESIGARFERGVLEVTVPKPAAAKAHRVQIGGRADQDVIEAS